MLLWNQFSRDDIAFIRLMFDLEIYRQTLAWFNGCRCQLGCPPWSQQWMIDKDRDVQIIFQIWWLPCLAQMTSFDQAL